MFKKLVAALVTTACCTPALAGVQTWGISQSVTGTTSSNYVTLTQGGITLTAKGWSDTKGGSDTTVERAKLVENVSTSTGTDYGLGIVNNDEGTSSPSHSMDNIGGDYDMISLEFSKAVNLSHVDIGWATDDGGKGNDGRAEMTFAAYLGGGDPSLNSLMNGKTWTNIASSFSGWSDSIHNVSTAGYQSIGSAGVFSKYWLVGAYNDKFKFLHGALNDGVKLKGVKTYAMNGSSSVPVPSSALLFLAGLMAFFAQKRTRATTAK